MRVLIAILGVTILIFPSFSIAQEGCQYDTQCKGDRICEKGVCVSPSTRPPRPPDQPEAAVKVVASGRLGELLTFSPCKWDKVTDPRSQYGHEMHMFVCDVRPKRPIELIEQLTILDLPHADFLNEKGEVIGQGMGHLRSKFVVLQWTPEIPLQVFIIPFSLENPDKVVLIRLRRL